MRPETVYAKTEAGQREIAHRSNALDGRHRTLLILLDGRRRVADLPPLTGGGEALARMLDRLEALGLIATGTTPVASPEPAPMSAPTPTDWTEQRRQAVRLLNETLGPAGDGLALRLESLRSGERLPEMLAHCRSLIADLRGEAAAERFAAALELP